MVFSARDMAALVQSSIYTISKKETMRRLQIYNPPTMDSEMTQSVFIAATDAEKSWAVTCLNAHFVTFAYRSPFPAIRPNLHVGKVIRNYTVERCISKEYSSRRI